MNKDNNNPIKNAKTKITSKQVIAMAGVILLVLLYVITLVVAIVDSSASGNLLWMCLFATVTIPMLIWIYTWMYGKLTGRKTITDLNSNAVEGTKPDTPPQTEGHQD